MWRACWQQLASATLVRLLPGAPRWPAHLIGVLPPQRLPACPARSSRECQQRHWSVHKKDCKKLRKAVAAQARRAAAASSGSGDGDAAAGGAGERPEESNSTPPLPKQVRRLGTRACARCSAGSPAIRAAAGRHCMPTSPAPTARRAQVLFSPERYAELAGAAPARKAPLGLANVGNSCYANSLLQSLLATPTLAAYLVSGAGRACDVLTAGLGWGGAAGWLRGALGSGCLWLLAGQKPVAPGCHHCACPARAPAAAGEHSAGCPKPSASEWCVLCELEALARQAYRPGASGALSPRPLLRHVKKLGRQFRWGFRGRRASAGRVGRARARAQRQLRAPPYCSTPSPPLRPPFAGPALGARRTATSSTCA